MFDLSKIRQVNRFFKICWDSFDKIKWIQFAVGNYLFSLRQQNIPIRFITLCISLESLINGNTEITYQLSRMCALLNADTVEEGELIFRNVKKIYGARSEAVHGNGYTNTYKYYMYLLHLTSRTLIELITLNIRDKETLNQLIAVTGYGSKRKLSKGYRKEVFYEEAIEAIREELKK